MINKYVYTVYKYINKQNHKQTEDCQETIEVGDDMMAFHDLLVDSWSNKKVSEVAGPS